MSTEQHKAAVVRAPNDIRTGLAANNFGVLKFTATTTHAANALPDAWAGQWVRIYVITGGDLHFAFSTSSAAEVDRSVSATAAGASDKVGGFLEAASETHVRLPDLDGPNETLYFVRESSAAVDVYLQLASGR